MIQKFKTWWRELNKEYDEVNQELIDCAYGRLKTMIYLFMLTILFAFYKLHVLGVHNAREILNILFDWSLLGFALLFLILWVAPYLILNKFEWTRKTFPTVVKTLRWGAETTFDFAVSLIFISLVGIAMGAMDLPIINTKNVYVFVSFCSAIVFVIIWAWLRFFVPKGVKKLKEAQVAVACSAVIFLMATVIYQW
ncbi:hypothetical protein ACWLZS_004559 [Vibrio parahaemolyticus]|uniref:hypothetical protein n=1 Tax=Vibrio parahaemolyticus TaxID=670 RepID=UPI0015BBAEB6|nr:hypothetical protein [Vibrio parahaemolyticus]QLE30603.1 hypothetical protein FDV78_08450 [Vibrio parahaemolyticus]HCE4715332.1 hypothetical protein [Vibrio parahaemolyticus]HCG9795551.1 hypothetical protein [Vibrio parahaemolyticus]HCH4925038.1 hypothetical protein [Vibrio parahaemolyticus]